MATGSWDKQIGLAEKLGGTKRKRRGSTGGSTRVRSQSDFAKAFAPVASASQDDSESVLGSNPSVAERAQLGRPEMGSVRATKAYEAIMASDMPADMKARVKAAYESEIDPSEISEERSTLGKIFNHPLMAPVKTGLMVADKGKRAVVATAEELIELASGTDGYEGDRSWVDNVFRDEDYGAGDLNARRKKMIEHGGGTINIGGLSVDRAKLIDSLPGTGAMPGAGQRHGDNKWVDRIEGLAGDIIADPLTYVGGGAISRGVGGASSQLSARDVARRLADEADRAADPALHQVAAEVARRGARAATAEDLARVGVEGGLRFGGRQIVGHNTARELTKPMGALREVVGDSAVARRLQSVVGADELKELRKAVRDRSSSSGQVVHAIRHIDSVKSATRRAAVTTIAAGRPVQKIMQDLQAKKVDGVTMRAATQGDPAAMAKVAKVAPTAIDDMRTWFRDFRKAMNDALGFQWIADAGDEYVPRLLTKEAAEFIGRRRSRKAPSGTKGKPTFEHRAAQKGDTFGDHILGSDELHDLYSPTLAPGSRAAIEAQMEGLLREWGFAGELFSKDLFEDIPVYILAAENRLKQRLTAQELVQRGVATTDVTDLRRLTNEAKDASERAVKSSDAANQAGLDLADLSYKVRPKHGSTGGSSHAVDEAARRVEVARRSVDVAEDAQLEYGRRAEVPIEPNPPTHFIKDKKKRKLAQRKARNLATSRQQRRDAILKDQGVRAGDSPPVRRQKVKEYQEALGSAKAVVRQNLTEAVDEARAELVEAHQNLREFQDWAANNRLSIEGTPYSTEGLQEIADLAEQRVTHLEAAQRATQAGEKELASLHQMAAQHHQLVIDTIHDGRKAMGMEDLAKRFRQDKALPAAFSRQMDEAFGSMAEFGFPAHHLDRFHYDALTAAHHVAKEPSKFLEFYDKLNRNFKAWAIFSPGFHNRNALGAAFNNFVAGVTVADYKAIGRNVAQFRRNGNWDHVKDPETKRILELLNENGLVRHGGQVYHELAAPLQAKNTSKIRDPWDRTVGRLPGGKRLNPGRGGKAFGLTDNFLTRSSARLGNNTEDFHRTALAYSTMRRGGTVDEAAARVDQFHFDYQDLSSQEVAVAKRVIPFWTWTSRNMPLQMELIATRPRIYNRYQQIAANVRDDDEPHLVPSWMRTGASSIHLGGGQYLNPDLPFNPVDEQMRGMGQDPATAVLMDATPYLKTPLELALGRKAWNQAPIDDGLTEMPKSWLAIPGLRSALGSMGEEHIVERSDGTVMINARTAYAAEQAIPLLARAQRLFPDKGSRMAERRTASVLSFFGIPLRTATDRDKRSQAFSLAEALEDVRTRHKQLNPDPDDE